MLNVPPPVAAGGPRRSPRPPGGGRRDVCQFAAAPHARPGGHKRAPRGRGRGGVGGGGGAVTTVDPLFSLPRVTAHTRGANRRQRPTFGRAVAGGDAGKRRQPVHATPAAVLGTRKQDAAKPPRPPPPNAGGWRRKAAEAPNGPTATATAADRGEGVPAGKAHATGRGVVMGRPRRASSGQSAAHPRLGAASGAEFRGTGVRSRFARPHPHRQLHQTMATAATGHNFVVDAGDVHNSGPLRCRCKAGDVLSARRRGLDV